MHHLVLGAWAHMRRTCAAVEVGCLGALEMSKSPLSMRFELQTSKSRPEDVVFHPLMVQLFVDDAFCQAEILTISSPWTRLR